MTTEFTKTFLAEAQEIAATVDFEQIEAVAAVVAKTRDRGGRIFFLGSGGGAGHASHAVNDFRKIAGIECYSPSDNVSELTARVNDEGWGSSYANWLRVSRVCARDTLFVFSVGGGDVERNISPNLVQSLLLAKEIGAEVVGIVGRDGGLTARVADACVLIPTVAEDRITPHTEAFQAVIWHLLVSHPRIRQNETKWESQRVGPCESCIS